MNPDPLLLGVPFKRFSGYTLETGDRLIGLHITMSLYLIGLLAVAIVFKSEVTGCSCHRLHFNRRFVVLTCSNPCIYCFLIRCRPIYKVLQMLISVCVRVCVYCYQAASISTNTVAIHWTSAGSRLGQYFRRWPRIETPLDPDV